MASQFSAEDQTDEDFFDKLVEDDFSVTELTSASQNGSRIICVFYESILT